LTAAPDASVRQRVDTMAEVIVFAASRVQAVQERLGAQPPPGRAGRDVAGVYDRGRCVVKSGTNPMGAMPS
jgi:hypothetical protein